MLFFFILHLLTHILLSFTLHSSKHLFYSPCFCVLTFFCLIFFTSCHILFFFLLFLYSQHNVFFPFLSHHLHVGNFTHFHVFPCLPSLHPAPFPCCLVFCFQSSGVTRPPLPRSAPAGLCQLAAGPLSSLHLFHCLFQHLERGKDVWKGK